MVDFISKSKIIFFVLLFFTVVFTSWHMLRTDVSADPLYDSSQVVITTQIGYGNRLILNKCIPVFVTVDNRTEDTIKGELCISFSGDVGYSAYSGGPSQNEYRTDVTIPPNVKKTMTVSVYQNSYRNSIDSSVIDKNGNVLCSSVNFLKYTNLNYRGNDFPVLVGVLTDDPDQLRYLSNLENSPVNAVGYNDSQYYVEYLNTDSFPTNKTEISSFDFIIVNDFDISSSSSLSDEQKILLQYYIETGGNVLVGTGQNADLAVKGFSSYFTSPPSSIVSKIGAQNILMEKYTAEDLYYVSLQDEQLTEIDWFKCQREIAKNSYEEIGGLYKNKTYSIYFTSWDLAQTTFSQWIGASDYIKNMILSNITTESQFTFLPDAYSFDALKLIPENAYPNVTVLILILAGYTILTGPVLYIVFKKLKKREALWIAIPSVVVLFCAVVFCYGYIVRGGGNISSSVSIVELNSSEQKPIIQATSVMTAKQGDMSLDFGKNTIFYNKYDDSLERVFYQGEDAKEVVKGVTMWSFADATASREISQYFGVLDVQVSYNDDGSTNQIMITNNSEYDISNIIVYADGKFGIVSTLNRYATETVKPNEPDIFNALSQAYFGVDNGALSGTNNFPANYYYYNSVYNNGTSLNLPDSATADEQIRASLMYTFLNTVSHSGTGNIVVAGFAEAGNEVFPLHVNGKKPAKQRNNTLVYQVVKKEKGKLYSMNVSNEQVGIETLENVTGTQNIYNESIHDVFPLTVNGTSSAMYFEIVLPQNMFLSGAKVSVYVESPEARQMEIYIGGTPVEFSTNTEFVLPLDVKTYLNFYYNYPQSTYYNNVNQDIHVKGIWQNILQGTQFISFYINFPDSKPWTIDNILYSVTLDD